MNKKAISGIYKIRNKVNGKFYIGSSINIKKRWWEHKKSLNNNTHINVHLQASWNKHGKDNFEFTIEEIIEDRNILLEREQKIIEECYDGGKQCYNISRNTSSPDLDLIKKPILQLDKKTGELIKEWASTADAERELGYENSSIRLVCKGIRVSAKGFKWKYKKEELANKYPAKQGQHGGHGKKKIAKINPATYEIIEIYESVEIAAKKNQIKSYASVIGVAAGRRLSTNKCFFRYLNDDGTVNKLEKDMINTITNFGKIQCKLCLLYFDNNRKLASHLQYVHKVKTEEYTISHMYDGIRPSCAFLSCSEPVRYVSFGFKRYCNLHSALAESEGGKSGASFKKAYKANRSILEDVKFESREGFDELLYASPELLSYKGQSLSGSYIASLSKDKREELVEPLFRWFRKYGVPYRRYTNEEMVADYKKLTIENLVVNGDSLSNKNLTGNKVIWHFQSENFNNVKAVNKKSLTEAFMDDEVLRSVIRNRLGITYKETFNITGAMLLQGFRSTASCGLVSIFNPLIAKYVWDHAKDGDIVYDYSMGFGHRMIGAMSSRKNLHYIASDPWKSVVDKNREIANFLNFGDRVTLINDGAENFNAPELENKIGVIFSSPPYFDKEIYDNAKQDVYTKGKDWFLNTWWNKVVQNSYKHLREDGLFVLNMFEKLIEPMHQIILANGFSLYKKEGILLNKSHLSKTEAGNIQKLEPVWFYKKNT